MTLLETVIQELRAATNVAVRYGRARDIDGTQVVVTQDETAESAYMAEREFDINVFAPGPDPSEIERIRRAIERTLHRRLLGEADDAGAVRLRLESQEYVEDEDDWTHWTARVVARFFRKDAAAARGK